jgi:hypothetical protein
MRDTPPFALPPGLWPRFVTACEAQGIAVEAMLADLIRLEVQRHARSQQPRTPSPDPALLARLRLLVAAALAVSNDWDGYARSLELHGLTLRPSGGGLLITDQATGQALCKGSDVGPGYLALARRFGRDFPGHPNPVLTTARLPLVSDRVR